MKKLRSRAMALAVAFSLSIQSVSLHSLPTLPLPKVSMPSISLDAVLNTIKKTLPLNQLAKAPSLIESKVSGFVTTMGTTVGNLVSQEKLLRWFNTLTEEVQKKLSNPKLIGQSKAITVIALIIAIMVVMYALTKVKSVVGYLGEGMKSLKRKIRGRPASLETEQEIDFLIKGQEGL